MVLRDALLSDGSFFLDFTVICTLLIILHSRCVEENLAPGYEGCYADVLNTAHRKCSGRNSCSLSIPDPDFEATKPCSELQNYLETKYECLKGKGIYLKAYLVQ